MQTLTPPIADDSAPAPGGEARAHRTAATADRLLERLFSAGPERWGRLSTLAVVAGTTAFVVAQLHPGLLFLNTEDVGGDTAAHIAAPYYFIHYLLPHGRISGWDSWWFDGFPLYVFYFPLPALVVALFNLVAPYAVAFKLVTALGTATLPICCYAFGRLCGLERPTPALFSAGSVVYLFNRSYTIDGGNVFSTMAGEFSFSLALSFALLFLGTFVYALRTGRLRWLAAVLYVLCLLCHVVPAIFCAGLAVLLALAYNGTRPFRRVLLPVGVAAGLLSAFWLLPFAAYTPLYSSTMNYGPEPGGLWANIFPRNGVLAVVVLALAGFALGIWHASRVIAALGLAALGCAAMFQWGPRGLVYNGRWLPFWYLCVTLLAAYAVAELGRLSVAGLRNPAWQVPLTALLGGGLAVSLVAAWLGVMPFGLDVELSQRNVAEGWIAFNYKGYQETAGWPEYHQLITMLDAVGARYGCGRLDFEYTGNDSNWFGSTLVDMAFPLWTNGCIDDSEGVYFESATTTHFHFLDMSELSIASSDPVGGLLDGVRSAYQPTDVADGVRHLALQGVSYYLTDTPQLERQANADAGLARLTLPDGPIKPVPANPDAVDYNPSAQKAPNQAEWDVYLVKGGASLVTPLRYDPVVEDGLDVTSIANLAAPAGVALRWYQDERYWDVPIAASGPAAWRRDPLGYLAPTSRTTAVVPTTVSDVRHDKSDSWISFHVGRLGSPVEVKIPFFPNWHASGALGPYLVTPNLMVVVPTAHEVRLSYGTTTIDWVGSAATAAGVAALVTLNRSPAPPPEPAPPTTPATPPGPIASGTGEARAADDEPERDEQRRTEDTDDAGA